MNQELQNALAALANKMGTSVEHLWPILVRREFVGSVIAVGFGIALGLIGLMISIYGFYRLRHCKELRIPYVTRTSKQDNIVAVNRMLAWLPMMLLFFSAMQICCNLGDMLVPESGALRSIVSLVR